MCMNFAVMDWVRSVIIISIGICNNCSVGFQQNENISRPSTSEQMYVDLRRPDRRTPRRLLVRKTFKSVHIVWAKYTECNQTDAR